MNPLGSLSRKLLHLFGAVLACALAMGQTSAPSQNIPRGSTTNSRKSSHKKGAHKKGKRASRIASWRRGQQKVDSQRTLEIQEALIRERYLKGEPTGRWDDATQRAMQRYQSHNGWQVKTVPDSRALIKLGLGPSHDHLLNPESAMTTRPQGQSANGTASPAADSSHSPNQK